MSIEICNKCALRVNTDFDTETIIYQNNGPHCRDCAEMQCYSYQVKIKGQLKRYIGWINAITLEDAEIELYDQYNNIEEIAELKHQGTWKAFLKTGDTYGWD